MVKRVYHRDWGAIEAAVRERGIVAAANEHGAPYMTVYTRAVRLGWVRALPQRAPRKVQRWRCQECYQQSLGDPCDHCGAAIAPAPRAVAR